ncbi:NEDD8 ultimate buster 1-like isoform X1 [Hemiscyllium ocellatum]|uniref:NEDD8 ultimate buster 1-like isoform X1 n=2 Tax=Hemiscyllium ocellatum TaxID=170820 RepID=UPI00296690BD|nr:NEDD8 ultimate buster 1-like isoform X1 [Hemiscyllium ocellatum]
MAERRQIVNQQEQDIGHATDSGGGVSQEAESNSSGNLLIRIALPKLDQEKERKIQITISPNATGLQFCNEISKELPNIDVEKMELIYKGKFLDKSKSLAQQKLKNKGMVMLKLTNKFEQVKTINVSRIRKGAEALAKRGEDFEHPHLKIVNHQGEIIEVPEEKRVIILTALILHEAGKSDMKKGAYEQAFEYLTLAELEFRQCDEMHLNSIDNYGVLCLDMIWCNFQLKKAEYLKDARIKLEEAQECFNKCFGENQERLRELQDDSGRHHIQSLRLHVLWGVWFYHNQMEKDAEQNLNKAGILLERLRLDDSDLADLVNQGFTIREARLALRATEGNIEDAKMRIRKRRERAQQQKREMDERRQQLSRQATKSNTDVPEENRRPDQGNQNSLSNTKVLTADENSSSASPAPSSPSIGAQGSFEDEDLLQEILALLPEDNDDYINVTLEDEEAVISSYKALLTNKGSELCEEAPSTPKKGKTEPEVTAPP